MRLLQPAVLTLAALASAATLAALPGTARAAAFDIQLTFDNSVSASQQVIFNQAATTWESLVLGYRPNINITALTISVTTPAIDGPGGILGSAGPNLITSQGGFTLATAGTMQFDSADTANLEASGSFGAVVLHEMAHVMGFGTLWTNNNVYVNNSGVFLGLNANATYRTEFNQPAAVGVPVELGGGGGTANGHFNEVDGGAGLTGIVDSQGRDFRNELMTGWLNAPTFISNTTVQSFSDIGYVVVPEPSTFALIGGAMVAGLAWRRRARRQG